MTERVISINCPYCNKETYMKITDLYSEKQMIICDSEEGGCGKEFFVKTKVEVSTEILVLSPPEEKPLTTASIYDFETDGLNTKYFWSCPSCDADLSLDVYNEPKSLCQQRCEKCGFWHNVIRTTPLGASE